MGGGGLIEKESLRKKERGLLEGGGLFEGGGGT